MNDLPRDEAVGARMQGIRGDIDRGLDDVSAGAHNLVDWRHYVRTYPWVCLGTAAVLGFLIVPKRSATVHTDSATLTELARTGHLVVTPAVAGRGLFGHLVATLASVAVREATAYLGHNAGRLLGITGHPETGHDSNVTS